MSSKMIMDLEQRRWIKVVFLVTFLVILLSALIIRISWKFSHILIPRIDPTKKWMNWTLSAGQVSVLAILFLFINLWYQPELINDGTSLYKNTLKTQSKMVKKIEKPNHIKELIQPFTISAKEKHQLLARINITALEEFEKWLSSNKCGAANTLKIEEMKNNTVLALVYKSAQSNAILQIIKYQEESSKDLLEWLENNLEKENANLGNYETNLSKFLENASTSLGGWEDKIKARLQDPTANKNFHLKYMLPGATIIAFSLFSVYCSILYTKVQIVRLGRNFLYIFFYAVTIEALLLSLYELYSNVSLTCQTGVPQGFSPFQVPRYLHKSAKNSCTTARGSIYPKGYTAPVFQSLNAFNKEYEHASITLFSNNYLFGKAVQTDFQFFQQVPETLKTLTQTCPEIEAYQELVDSTQNVLNAYLEKWNMSGNITEQAIKFARHVTRNMNEPIKKMNQQYTKVIKKTNFDCEPIYALYRHSHGEACVPLSSIYICNLELAIIGCSALLAVLHLFYLRRSDHTQFWKDPRVRWAHKFITDNIDDDQLSEWKSTICYDLANVTYKNFYANPTRNRYPNIKCVDESRVVLKDHTTDYIHASWVAIPGTRRRYIATQAPMVNTFDDFWHMINQEKVEVILQLCGYIENDVRICDFYFPAKRGISKTYGHVEVMCVEMRIAPESTGLWQTVWRTFRLTDTNDRNQPARMIHHVFFQNWFDELVPKDSSRIPNLYRWVNSLNGPDSDAPICVMCDTGVGRTGVYITFDYANSLIEQDSFVSMADVNNRVARLRWGVVDAYLEFLFIFISLVTLYIQEGLLYFEDWAMPFKKYDYFLKNRVARMDRTRSDKQIEIQYWKIEQNPE